MKAKKKKLPKKKRQVFKVYYDGLPDEQLEKELIKLMKRFGYRWYGQGYNTKKNKRDVAFEKAE